MRFLAVDPSSTVLGWAVMDFNALEAYGLISTDGVDYERRFTHITAELRKIYDHHGFDEIACERAVRFKGMRVPALEVAVMTIKKFAQRWKWLYGKAMPIRFYSPSEWKASAIGHGNATKDQVARIVCLEYKQLPEDVSNHITDAIGIGIHHRGLRKLEEMAGE